MEDYGRMNEILLLNTTHNEQIDDILKRSVATFEEAFSGRIRGYYIEGSYADGSGIPTSDIDLLVIFKDAFADEQERAVAEEVARQCVSLGEVEMDIQLTEEEHLYTVGIRPALKMGSMVIYGEDIRESLPLISLQDWTRDRMQSSYWRTVNLFKRPFVVTYPLTYPDPDGEFYGYDQRKLRLADGSEVNCTRDLIRLIGWSATAILAFKARQYVARKSDCQRLYANYIADEWTATLYDTYTLCRGRWNYLIPDSQGERRLLRLICSRTLAFENHFLLIYKEFLLGELRSHDVQGKLQALWVLSKIPYKDAEVEAAVRALGDDTNRSVRKSAVEAIQSYEKYG
jgi:predicted nucleotidyltransferase